MKMTLPTDSAERKEIPITSGVLKYAPAALAGVARISMEGNKKHNGDQPLHHARGKSTDHSDCIVRHLIDVNDIEAYIKRELDLPETSSRRYGSVDRLLSEVSQMCWRALIWSQELHEKYGGVPLAPGARLPSPCHDALDELVKLGEELGMYDIRTDKQRHPSGPNPFLESLGSDENLGW
jgi:hypothetical protein